MHGNFEREVYNKIKEFYPLAKIKTNALLTINNLTLEIDLIISINKKTYAIECKDINKKQIGHLSKSIAKLRLINNSKLFNMVILLTSISLPKLITKRYIKSGIKILNLKNFRILEKPINNFKRDNLIDKIANKHNLTDRQIAILLGLKSKKQIYDYKYKNIPYVQINRLKALLEFENSRELHFKAFINSINKTKLFYRFFREEFKLSQKEFSKILGVNNWVYTSFETGLEDQKYLYNLIESKIANICVYFHKDYSIIKKEIEDRTNKELEVIKYAKRFPQIVGFNFPSILSKGKEYENKVKVYLSKIFNDYIILSNIVIADESISRKYEIDFLLFNKKEMIIAESKKSLSNDGHSLSNLIAAILERSNVLKTENKLLITSSTLKPNEIKRFNNANIELIYMGS